MQSRNPSSSFAMQPDTAGDAHQAGTARAPTRPRWTYAVLGIALCAAALAPTSRAQSQVLIGLGNASIFEGNPGTNPILRFPLFLSGPNATPITGLITVAPLSGAGFSPAAGGAHCGAAGVDFEQYTNVPFTIPAGGGSYNVAVTICGDSTVEGNKNIFAALTNVSGGGFCTPEACTAIGTIVNDDGPPSISPLNVTVTEPAVAGSTKIISVPVTLHHPNSGPVSVSFATRDGTARCTSPISPNPKISPDYLCNSGSVQLQWPASAPPQPNQVSGTILVAILGDHVVEADETFFVDLISATNGSPIANSTATVTIRDNTVMLQVGGYALSPDRATVDLGDKIAFDLVWTVPQPEVWRNLQSLDFRVGGPKGLWIRWDEASNTFSLCQKASKGPKDPKGPADLLDDDAAAEDPATDDPRGPGVQCGLGATPGSPTILGTPAAQLYLAETTVQGSGPTGQDVALHMVVSFGPDLKAPHTYKVELAAADDLGHQDKFVKASSIRVE